MKFLELLKQLPVDLGQGALRKKTKGKLIAMSLVGQTNEDKLALDVGCREGEQTKFLISRGYQVKSIDIKKLIPECIVMDANKKLDFNDGSFDLIWCSEVIEHLDNPLFTVNEFKRVLRPGGRIIITTPNSYCWIFRLIYFLFKLKPKDLQRKDHKHFFNTQDIKKMFPRADIYGFFPYFLVKFRIKKAVGLLSPTFIILKNI